MFPQLKKLNNESGIVLFIVLMTAIIIMIFSVGILSQSMNEINYAQQQIDQITCDQLTKGSFWSNFATEMTGFTNAQTVNMYIQGSGRTYQVTLTQGATSAGITSYSVNCSYDTF